MFIDARELDGHEIVCDICIIGAGAAGIAMAMELKNSGQEVVLLEAGGLDFDGDTQDLYKGETLGHAFPPLDVGRLRYFGGTTNHWEGMSAPFDPFDFDAREQVASSGWPISLSDLAPFYERACHYCELGSNEFEPQALSATMGETLPWNFTSGTFRMSPPTRFGETYRAEIEAAESLRAILHANVTSIELEDSARAVSHLEIATLEGQRLTLRARHYVLACGGIENARLLLNSDSVTAGGVGNENDLVGRYFMDHPMVWDSSLVELTRSDERFLFYANHWEGDTRLMGVAAPSQPMQDEAGILNCCFSFHRFDFTADSQGIQSAKSILGDFPNNFWGHVTNIARDMDDLARAAYRKTVYSIHTHYETNFWIENAPRPDSRVFLAEERDALGLRRAALDWKLGEEELRTYRVAHELLGRQLGELGLGRLRMLVPDDSIEALQAQSSHHHCGTTRMHDDPKQGVVDRNCRVHGVGNLYVAGSSVFATCGHVNPTLTLVALALRLSDHLQRTA